MSTLTLEREAQPAPLEEVGRRPQRIPQDLPWRIMAPVAVCWSLIVGGWFCQTLAGAIFVVGWVQRWVRRVGVAYCWRVAKRHALSPIPDRADFLIRLGQDDLNSRLPHWIWGELEPGETPGGGIGQRLARIARTWKRNLLRGFGSLINLWIFTIPALAIVNFAWYDGWNNSFHKGYEQHWVGLSTSLVALAFWITAMLYIPVSQARQAFTGEWQSFYDLGTNIRLIRRVGWWNLAIVVLCGLCSLPLLAMRVVPYFMTQELSAGEMPSSATLLRQLNGYHLALGPAVLALYAIAHYFTARCYSQALVDEVRYSKSPLLLTDFENRVLDELHLPRSASRSNHFLVRSLVWTWGSLRNATLPVLLSVAWFLVFFAVYVQQFVNFVPRWGFLNHPILHAPWVRFIPDELTLPDARGGGWLGFVVLCVVAAVLAVRQQRGKPTTVNMPEG